MAAFCFVEVFQDNTRLDETVKALWVPTSERERNMNEMLQSGEHEYMGVRPIAEPIPSPSRCLRALGFAK